MAAPPVPVDGRLVPNPSPPPKTKEPPRVGSSGWDGWDGDGHPSAADLERLDPEAFGAFSLGFFGHHVLEEPDGETLSNFKEEEKDTVNEEKVLEAPSSRVKEKDKENGTKKEDWPPPPPPPPPPPEQGEPSSSSHTMSLRQTAPKAKAMPAFLKRIWEDQMAVEKAIIEKAKKDEGLI